MGVQQTRTVAGLSSTFAANRLAPFRARLREAHAAATSITEQWDNLSGVAGSNGVRVLNNHLEVQGAAPNAAKIAWNLTGTTGRATARIFVPSSGYGVTMFGVAGQDTAPKASSTDSFLIGFRSTTGYAGYLRGTEVGGSGQADLSASALASGWWVATVVVDEDSVSLTLTAPDGVAEYRRSVARSAFDAIGGVRHIVAYAASSNGWIGPVSAVTGRTVSLKTFDLVGADVTGGVHGSAYFLKTGDNYRIQFPNRYDPSTPRPLAIWLHNASGTAVTGKDDTRMRAFMKALSDNGFIVASADAADASWGNDSARQKYRILHDYCRAHYAISSVVTVGVSMGNTVALNMLARGEIAARAHLSIAGVANLDTLYANPSYTAQIDTAFGISGDYETKTTGYRPEDREGWEFGSVPMMFVTSPSDTTCPQADAQAIVNKAKVYAPEATEVVSTGVHLDTAQFTAATNSGIPFLLRYV